MDTAWRTMKHGLVAVCAGMTVWLVPAAGAFAQSPALVEHFTESWTTRDGLPHNTVNDITQTADGYMWFATWEGAVRYNGREFQVFDRSPLTGLPDSGIRTLSRSDRNGLLLGGARGALAAVHNGDWENYPPVPTLVNSVMTDSQGYYWVATQGAGLFRQHPNGGQRQYITPTPPAGSDVVSEVIEIPGFGVVAATSYGVVHLTFEQLDTYSRFEPLPGLEDLPSVSVLSLYWNEPTGDLVIGTERGVYCWNKATRTLSQSLPDYQNFPISKILKSTDGSWWLGTTDRGLLRVTGERVERFTVDQGLPNNRVVALFEDRENSIWIGTNGGLVRMRDAPITSYTRAKGLSDNFVRTVLARQDGSMLIGTSRGLNEFSNGIITPFGDQPLRNLSVLSLAESADGDIWVGTYADGVLRIRDGELVEQYTSDDGLPANEVRAVWPDSNDANILWVGSAQGLVRVDRDAGTMEVIHENMPGSFIVAIKPGFNAGELWIGTGEGLGLLDISGEQVDATTIDIAHLDHAQYVFGIHRDDAGQKLWFATDRGLIRYDPTTDQYAMIGRQQGLPFDKYFATVIDQQDAIWLSSNRGLVRLDLAEANAAADAFVDGHNEPVVVEIFGESDGMASSQANGGSSPAVAMLPDGRLWFPTAMGTAVIQPNRLASFDEQLPPVVIESVVVDGEARSSHAKASFAPITNRIEFNFVGLGYAMPQRLRYQTRLLGFDRDWIERGNQLQAEYTNLPPGDYEFQVRVGYANDTERHAITSYSFTIKPEFWHYRAFWVGVLIVLMGLVLLGYRWRLGRLQASERRLLELVKEQTEELERQAREDQLTGLANRRAFDERLAEEFARAQRHETPLALALMDLDYFKNINDKYSHAVGDKVLKQVAKTLQRLSRQSDFVARWGGEEFVILMPGSDVKEATKACERVRVAISELNFNDIDPELRLTTSFGIAMSNGLSSVDRLLIQADGALYRAKSAGRNKVVSE